MVGDLIAGLVGKVLDRVWPDPAQKAVAAMELERMRQAGEFKEIDAAIALAQMQVDVNKVEAGHRSLFVSGWRPYLGWTCGAALGWHYIGRPVAVWLSALAGSTVEIPVIELGDLIVILLGMLGLSGLRTKEKIERVAAR